MGVGSVETIKENMIAEIDLMENAVYVVKDGQVIKISPKQYGEDTIIWKDGKALDVVRSQRHRLTGQEVI
jgi:hypothetical protein